MTCNALNISIGPMVNIHHMFIQSWRHREIYISSITGSQALLLFLAFTHQLVNWVCYSERNTQEFFPAQCFPP